MRIALHLIQYIDEMQSHIDLHSVATNETSRNKRNRCDKWNCFHKHNRDRSPTEGAHV